MKRIDRLKNVAKQSLNSFIKVSQKSNITNMQEFIYQWEGMTDRNPIFDSVANVQNIESVLGFGKQFSRKLLPQENQNIAFQRLAELDLAVHILREQGLTNNKLESSLSKIIETDNSECDFTIESTGWYFESKFTSNISKQSIEKIVDKAISQIISSAISKKITGAWVWIFTFQAPSDGIAFQTMIEEIQAKSKAQLGFNYCLSVQTYSRGLYGTGEML